MGLSITTLKSSYVDSMIEESIKYQPHKIPIILSDVSLIDETLCKYKGRTMGLSDEAFINYIEFLKIPKAFLDRFAKSLGTAGKISFANSIKEYTKVANDLKVTMVIDLKEKEILGFLPDAKTLVTNDSFLNHAMEQIKKYHLLITDFCINQYGDTCVNTVSPLAHMNLEKYGADELFQCGISFTNSYKRGYEAETFVLRLSCQSGMVFRKVAGYNQIITMRGFDDKGLSKFNIDMQDVAINKFLPEGFERRLRRAMITNASLFELFEFMSYLQSYTKGSGIEWHRFGEWIDAAETINKFEEYGYDFSKMTLAEKKHFRCNLKIWELVTGLARYASHENELFTVTQWNRNKLKVKAGELFLKKSYDTEHQIKQLF